MERKQEELWLNCLAENKNNNNSFTMKKIYILEPKNFGCLLFFESLGKLHHPFPPLIHFLPWLSPTQAGWTRGKASLELLTTGSGHLQVILNPKRGSRALKCSSKPGKTARRLQKKPGNLASTCCRINGKNKWKKRKTKLDMLTSPLIQHFLFWTC